MSWDRTHIRQAAERYATEHLINDEKRIAFQEGVRWTIDQLIRRSDTNHHPMLDPKRDRSTIAYIRELDLKSVRAFIEAAMEIVEEPDGRAEI